MAKVCYILCSFLLGIGRGNVRFLETTGFLEAVPRLALGTKESSQHKVCTCLPHFSFPSFQHCEGGTLHWSDPLQEMETLEREWISHSGHWLTPACLPFLQHWWLLWSALLHESAPSIGKTGRDIELGHSVCSSSMARFAQSLAHSYSELEQATWFLVADRDSWKPSERRHQQPKNLSWHKVWGVCQTQGFIRLCNIAKRHTLHWSDPSQKWQLLWWRNGSLPAVTGWHLHVCPFFRTSDG